ncbi:hypothetical protein [Maribacter sp. 2308TA10-17]|uniref:hypothetical protein n=1 Tax=Maribacter sp. 2308TA10-17 TaxID=3386276 RepID=UPI0039BCF435
MKLSISSFLIVLVLWLSCCSSSDETADPNIGMEEEEMQETTDGVAQVTNVSVSGTDDQYTFSVTISSPDLGCNQYANWWEVIDLDGNLLYRRILGHSHVEEQPFTRSGGPVSISADTEVYIRAHMNTTSYGSRVFRGTVSSGFIPENLSIEFAKDLEEAEPLHTGCAF